MSRAEAYGRCLVGRELQMPLLSLSSHKNFNHRLSVHDDDKTLIKVPGSTYSSFCTIVFFVRIGVPLQLFLPVITCKLVMV